LHVTEAETEVELHLTYIINRAAWNASYDCRVNSETCEMQLIYYGNIVNNTGEDWKQVCNNPITFSNVSANSKFDRFCKFALNFFYLFFLREKF
jgi:hypothetical protein